MKSLYHSGDTLNYKYTKAPKYLFDEPYSTLSNNAKLLYILMIDRLSLSIDNRLTNEQSNHFIFYSRENMKKDLNIVSNTTITNAIKELHAHGLITEQRCGINKANRIFIYKV